MATAQDQEKSTTEDLTTVLVVMTRAVRVTWSLRLSVVLQRHRDERDLPAITDLDVPSLKVAPREATVSRAEYAEDHWKSMRLQARLSTGTARKHVLHKEHVEDESGSVWGCLAAATLSLCLQIIQRDEQLRLDAAAVGEEVLCHGRLSIVAWGTMHLWFKQPGVKLRRSEHMHFLSASFMNGKVEVSTSWHGSRSSVPQFQNS